MIAGEVASPNVADPRVLLVEGGVDAWHLRRGREVVGGRTRSSADAFTGPPPPREPDAFIEPIDARLGTVDLSALVRDVA